MDVSAEASLSIRNAWQSLAKLRDYDKYITAINNLEEVEQLIITEPKYRRCCYSLLEICKGILQYLKLKKK